MDKQQFYETYCLNCGTQRCEGIDTEWFEGCSKRWNFDGYDAASEIERLNDKITELSIKLVKNQTHGEWIKISYTTLYKCSVCTHMADMPYQKKLFDYCPNCGADMRGVHKDA